MKLAAANGSAIKVEGDARLDFMRNGAMCSMNFLDADVKRPLASVGAIVDEGNKVVFGKEDSYIENLATGQRIPLQRKNGVFMFRIEKDEDTKMNIGRGAWDKKFGRPGELGMTGRNEIH